MQKFRLYWTLEMLCQICLKVTRPVLRILRLTTAAEANKVQENVVTAKKGKKRPLKIIRIVVWNNNE